MTQGSLFIACVLSIFNLSSGEICLSFWPEPSFVYVGSKDSCEAVRMLTHVHLKQRCSPISMVPIRRSQRIIMHWL